MHITYLAFRKYMEEDIKKEMWFQKEHERISETYTKIYIMVFKYALPILWVIVSIFILNKALNSNYLQNIFISSEKDINYIRKTSLVKNFKNSINQNIDDKNIKIQIIQWKLYTELDSIYSKNNLINYKWYIMPKLFTIKKDNTISEISYFDSDSYNIDRLEEFIKNIIFINKSDLNIEIEKNKQLNLDQDIEKTFNLSCLSEKKITYKMCNYYINEFLKYFFVYDLKTDIQWLKKIGEKISTTPKYKDFCNWIKNYIIYSNYSENNLKEIIENCSKIQPIEEINKIENFIEIQKELEKWYIKDKYYAYKDLNSYKLLSFQQILYNDITSKKIDTISLNNYIGFVKNLIKKNNIEQFYKEEIYRFNNYYLIKNLEDSKENILFPIITDLYFINQWALMSQIKNQNLKTYQQNTTGQSLNMTWNISWNQTTLTETLLKWLYNTSFFTITNSKIITKDTVSIIWYFQIWNKAIKTDLLLERYQNNLIIKSINLQKYSLLTKIISNLTKNENRWLNKAYQYIVENIENYWKEDEEILITDIWFCDILKTKTSYNTIECSEQSTLIEKDWITYKFFIKDETVYDIDISDIETENKIKQQLQESWYNNIGLINTIRWILDYYKTQEIVITMTWNENSILITEIFQEYLWIVPNDVIESKWSFFLSFNLQNINFIAEFNLTGKIIKALYFQDITENWKLLDIKWFSLLLNENNKEEINQFLVSPINYIKKLDSSAYINYENMFNKKQ